MKILRSTILVTIVLVCLTSCKKFLEVGPKTDVAQEELFSTQSGFKDALSGVYIQLGDDFSYGKSLSMTTLEYLVSSWTSSAQTVESQLGLFNYEDARVEQQFEAIFNKHYHIIANLNVILTQVESKKDILDEGYYELIKGESLALRAFLHFDLLRLFGPVPKSNASSWIPPFVRGVSKTSQPSVSATQFRQYLREDLIQAKELLQTVDPFLVYKMLDFRNGNYNPTDKFWNHRHLRMNVYAVTALQARIALWFDEKEEAFAQAMSLIESTNADGSLKFTLGTAADFANQDFVLSKEHLFGLYDHNINTKFTSAVLYKGTNEEIINTTLYGWTGTDIRESNLWQTETESSISRYAFKKYKNLVNASNTVADFKQIPLLRIAEMYLIAVETGTFEQASAIWDTFRSNRGLSEDLPLDPSQRLNLILREYRKEFYGEGQSFYAYKRMNATADMLLFAPVGAIINYVVPVPMSESGSVQ